MTSFSTFFWILPSGCVLIALAFLVLWLHQRETRVAFWASAGFGVAGLLAMIDMNRDMLPIPLVIAVVPLQWLVIALLGQAHFVRHGISWDWPKLMLGLALPFGVHLYYFIVEPILAVRLTHSFIVCGLMLMLIAARLLTEGAKVKPIDRIIATTLVLSAIFYLLRAFLVPDKAQLFEADWVGSVSMLAMYFGNALAALAIALLLMLAIGMDVIAVHFLETRVDPLTGVGNRRALDDAIEDEAKAIAAVLMIDLDRFKAINDDLGHGVGDQVLVAVAQALDRQCSEFAIVTRVGGEEFALLVPAERKAAVGTIALVAHAAIGAITCDGLDRPLSASIGVAVKLPNEAVRDTLRRADIALYRAKAEGRDRIVTAPVEIAFRAPARTAANLAL